MISWKLRLDPEWSRNPAGYEIIAWSPVYRADPKPTTGVRAMTALALSLLAPAGP